MNLAVTNDAVLNIQQFDMDNFFYTKTFLFKRLTLSERLKRMAEHFFAFTLLIIFSPIYLLVAFAIKCTMGGSVLYTQTRVGKNGSLFKIIKFRTMIENAELESGPRLSCKNDPRVTRLGAFLRKSHLDEIPQLLNVISGDMSFIGPRPERPEFVEVFEKEVKHYSRRKEVRPGITGLAQICLPYDATAHEKIEYDLFYIENQSSLLFNFIISYYTALKMVTFFRH